MFKSDSKSRMPAAQDAAVAGRRGLTGTMTGAAPPVAASRAGAPSGFRLVRYFTATSLVLFVVVAVALGHILGSLLLKTLHDEYEHDNVNFAMMFSNHLWANDFVPLLRATQGRSAAEIKTAPQIPELHGKVVALAKGTTVFKVKLYDLKGMTVYSTELEQIGEDKSKNAGVIAAWRGATTSEIVHRNQFSALEGEVLNRDLMQSYIPQYDAASGKVAGVFEVYSDATRFLEDIRQKQWYIVSTIAVLLALLYLGLIVIVNAGQRVIARHGAERRRVEETLRDSEERFRGLVEQSLTGIYVLQDGTLAYVNPRFAELLGYAPHEITGLNPDVYVLAEDHAVRHEHIRALLEGRQHANAYTVRARRKDGTVIELGVHGARAVFNGRPAVLGMAQDITERKRAQDEIAAHLKRLERAMVGTVQAVSNVVDMRDPYTAGHERRVGGLARAIGAELGLTEERCKGLEIIGWVHDIGKIAIPTEILAKPGKLSPAEFALIKTHPQSGHDILKDVDFPWPLAQAILQHHERMDGSGYPQRLRGEQILLEARIIAVADVVEAMGSHRPYRPGLGIEAALNEIAKGSGRLYDPQVAEACLRLFRDKGYTLPT